MNPDLLDLVLRHLPGSEALVISVLFLAYIWNPLKSALQDIPTAFGWRSNGVKRKMQLEELALITEQLKDPSLSVENREMLDLRRTEILLSVARGVDFPAYLVAQVINISTDKQADGLTWSLIREVHDRIEWEQGRLQVEVRRSEKVRAVGNGGLAFIFFLYFILSIFSIFYSSAGIFTQDSIIRLVIVNFLGVGLGIVLLRDSLKTYHASFASRKLDALYLRLNPETQTKHIEEGTTPKNMPIPQE